MLVAAAVILIPEMLSGSDPQRPVEPVPASGEAPLKTYTIDLSKSPATQAAAIDDRAPPTEVVSTVDPALESQVGPESGAAEGASAEPSQRNDPALAMAQAGQSAATKSSTPPRAAESVASPQAKPANPSPRLTEAASSRAKPSPSPRATQSPAVPQAKPATAPPASEPAAPARNVPAADGRWAVQMGSFASRATAEKMVKELRADGEDAFVMPVKSGAATLYRVRVGPMQDRQSAQQTLNKLKVKTPGAAIVPHP